MSLRRDLTCCLLLLALVGLVFGQARHHGYLEWDDRPFVIESPAVTHGLSWEGIRWAFEANLTRPDPSVEYWMPVTVISRLADAEFGGMRPGWVHGMSVVYHAVASLVWFLAMRRLGMGRGLSLFAASVFAVHPLQVEAVSWASARKDVLAGLFGAGTVLAYAQYARKPSRGRYAVLLGVFAAGLMAKPSLLAFPVALLLLDAWPLARFGRVPAVHLVAEKLPLALLAGLSLMTTVLAQVEHGAVRVLDQVPLGVRLGNAAVAYVDFVRTFLWPVGLSPLYPHPGKGLNALLAVACFLGLVAATLVAWRFRQRAPWAWAGWGWFLVVLLPMMGFVQIGGAARADRYLYPVMVGLAWVLGRGVWEGAVRSFGEVAARRWMPVLGTAACAVLGGLAFRYGTLWRDTVPLFEYAARVTAPNRQAHLSLAIAWFGRGDPVRAQQEAARALRIHPGDSTAWKLLGRIAFQEGRYEQASAFFEALAAIEDGSPSAHFYLGQARERAGDSTGAIVAYRRAGELAPDWGRPLLAAAALYQSAGDGPAADRLRAEAARRPVGSGEEVRP